MARIVEFEGKRYEFPADATDAEIESSIIGAPAPKTSTNLWEKTKLAAESAMMENIFSPIRAMESGEAEQTGGMQVAGTPGYGGLSWEEQANLAAQMVGTGREKEERFRAARAGAKAEMEAIPDWYKEEGVGAKAKGLGATILGGLAGSITDPANLVAPLKGASVLATAAKNAMLQAGINSFEDVATQTTDMASGHQKDFSLTQAGAAAGIGAVLGGGLGALAHQAPTVEPTAPKAKSQFDMIREKRPETKDMTDAQITSWLTEQDNARTRAITSGEQQKLELDDSFGQRMMDDWRAEAQGELQTLREQEALARQEATGTKDMFQETGFPQRETLGVRNEIAGPADPLAKQADASPLRIEEPAGNVIEWDGGWKNVFQKVVFEDLAKIVPRVSDSPVLQRTMTEVNQILDNMVEIRNKAMVLYSTAADRRLSRPATINDPGGPGFLSIGDYEALHADYMAKFKEADDALQLQAYQLKDLAKTERDPMVQAWAEKFSRYLGDDVPNALRASMTGTLDMIKRQDESFLGLDIEKVKGLESLFGIPRWPDPIMSKVERSRTLAEMNAASKAASSATDASLSPKLDDAIFDRLVSGEKSMTNLLKTVMEHGTAAQRYFAELLLSKALRDTDVSFSTKHRVLENGEPDMSAGRYFYETNAMLLRKHENIGSVFLHEAAHAIVGGHIDNFYKAMKLVGHRFDQLPLDLQKRFVGIKALDDLFLDLVAKERTARGRVDVTDVHYGFSTLHEFYSEFVGSVAFRDYLRSVKLADLPSGRAEFMPWAKHPEIRALLSKAKTAYDVVMNAIMSIFGKRREVGTRWDAEHGIGRTSDTLVATERGHIQSMAPSEFMGMAALKQSMDITPFVTDARRKDLSFSNPTLWISWDETRGFHVSGHEGRNRVLEAVQRGESSVPVAIYLRDSARAARARQNKTDISFSAEHNAVNPDRVYSTRDLGAERPVVDDMSGSVLERMFELNMLLMDQVKKEDQFNFKWEIDEVASKDVNQLQKALPEGMKHLAKHLVETAPIQRVADPTEQRMTGPVADALKTVARDTRSWKEAKEGFAGIKDISGSAMEKLGQLFVAGGKGYSWIKEHGPLKWGVDTAYEAKRAARTRAQNVLNDPQTGVATLWRQLSSQEQGSLWKLILENKGVRTLDREQLISSGMNDKQVNAYLTTQRAFRDIINEANAERAAQGLKPIEPIPGYWPARWKGNFELIVRAPSEDPKVKGRIVHVERGNSLRALKALEEKFRKDGKFVVEEAKATPRVGELKDTFGLFSHLADTFEVKSPERQLLNEAMKRYSQELANERKYFRKHFDPISGVGGFLGTREGPLSPGAQAKEALEAMDGYVKDYFDWVHVNRAQRELSAFFKDSEEMGLKNTAKFVRGYWERANNHESASAHLINRTMEMIPEALGLDRNLPRDLAQSIRHELTMLMLGYFKPAFLMASMTQSGQFVRPMISLVEAKTGRKSTQGFFDLQWKGHNDTIQGLIQKNFEGKDGAWRKQGVEYLKDSGVISNAFLETAADVFDTQGGKALKVLRGEAAMIFVEKYARGHAFFQFARVLKEIAPELSQKQMFDAAADLAEMAMVNYSRTERAAVFHHLGIVGDVASALTTFKMNLATQLYKYSKEAFVNKAPKPLMQLLAAQAILAGAMGMPGRDELDSLFGLVRAHVPGMAGISTPTEGLMKLAQSLEESQPTWKGKMAADVIRYGPLSGVSGIDISPTFSAGAILPEPTLRAVLPVVEKAKNIGGAAIDVLGGELGAKVGGPGSTSADRMRLAKELSPAIGQGMVEKAFQTPEGIVPNPTREMAGTVRRPTDGMSKEWLARHMGARTTQESTDLRSAAVQRDKDQAIKDRQTELITKARKLSADGKDYTGQLNEYVKLGGDPTQFIQAMTRAGLEQNTTQKERDAMGASTLQRLQRYQNLQRMRGQ